jgi:hypothetical protein
MDNTYLFFTESASKPLAEQQLWHLVQSQAVRLCKPSEWINNTVTWRVSWHSQTTVARAHATGKKSWLPIV